MRVFFVITQQIAVDEDNDRTPSPVLSLSLHHTKKSRVEEKTSEAGKKCINHSSKLEEKEESFEDPSIQKTGKETWCSLDTDGE
jgi:hypothetical protein